MTLCNPRTEDSGYALVAIPLGMAIALVIRRREYRAIGIVLGALLFAAGLNGTEATLFGLTEYWFKPAMILVVLVGLLGVLVAFLSPRRGSVRERP